MGGVGMTLHSKSNGEKYVAGIKAGGSCFVLCRSVRPQFKMSEPPLLHCCNANGKKHVISVWYGKSCGLIIAVVMQVLRTNQDSFRTMTCFCKWMSMW